MAESTYKPTYMYITHDLTQNTLALQGTIVEFHIHASASWSGGSPINYSITHLLNTVCMYMESFLGFPLIMCGKDIGFLPTA